MRDPRPVLYLHHASILGGAERSLLNLFRNLDRNRFRPVIACPGVGPFAEALRSEGVDIRPMVFPRIRDLVGVRRTAGRIRQLVRELAPGVIHGNTPQSNFPGSLAGGREGVPVVWHMRNLVTRGQWDWERLFWRWPARIICNAEAIRRRFPARRARAGRVVTILNGVNLEEFRPDLAGDAFRAEWGIPADAFVVSVMSRLTEEKGQRTFLRAAGRLHGELPGVRFLLIGSAEAGDRAYEEELHAMGAAVGGSVIFAGFQGDMPRCFAATDVVVLASRAEPCGRVLFEAMASGRPVVATDSGGTPEIVQAGASGLLFPPGDDEALTRHLRRLHGNAELRRRLGEAGRRRAEAEFSIQAHVRRTEALYEEVLAEAGRRGPAGRAP